ncbi:hypothetical protein ALC57_11744 [Trachymyrmex cornetzi]|uniref:Uncharacterized protein n=1 Tax=Trachymyrmex cornetzi TaxID=471704 RepID=A0A151J281_9HYME|nr:hypothetical protein ALC57_11744 [Trachymyrmex cornetzi]
MKILRRGVKGGSTSYVRVNFKVHLITDHRINYNHNFNWKDVKILNKEPAIALFALVAIAALTEAKPTGVESIEPARAAESTSPEAGRNKRGLLLSAAYTAPLTYSAAYTAPAVAYSAYSYPYAYTAYSSYPYYAAAYSAPYYLA